MYIRITNWGTYDTEFFSINEFDIGLEGNIIAGFTIRDEKQFFLAVIKYGIEYKKVAMPIYIKMNTA